MKIVKLVYQRGPKGHNWVYPKPYNFYIKDELAEKIDPLNNGLIITTSVDEKQKDHEVLCYVLTKPVDANGDEGYKLLGDDTRIIKLKAYNHRVFARFLEAMAKQKTKDANHDRA